MAALDTALKRFDSEREFNRATGLPRDLCCCLARLPSLLLVHSGVHCTVHALPVCPTLAGIGGQSLQKQGGCYAVQMAIP